MRSQFRFVAITALVAIAMSACDGGSSPPPAPTVTLTSSATDVAVNGAVTLTWSSAHAASCTLLIGEPGMTVGPGGSQGVAVAQTSTYTISCSGRGGAATASVTVHAWSPPSSSLATDLISVLPNGTVQLTWSSQNSTTCVGSGGLSGTLALSGSQTSAPLTETTTFAIGCSNPVFGAATSTVVVKVVTSRYTVIELPMERAFALNDAGDVAGQRPPSPTYSGVYDAIAWIGGKIVDVRVCQSPPYCLWSYYPVAINADRTVIGGGSVIDHPMHPSSFVWHYGDDPGDGGGTSDRLNDINDAGQIVGGRPFGPGSLAMLISDGTEVLLFGPNLTYSTARAINAVGHIAGSFQTASDPKYHVFLYVDGTMKDLGTLGGGDCYATGINAADAIVGREDRPGGTRAFLYANSIFTDLGSLGGPSAWATGINDAGQIVGKSGPVYGPWRAFLYVDDRMHDLNDLVAPLPMVLSEAPKINNRGQIIANACPPPGTPGACHAYLLTPVSPP